MYAKEKIGTNRPDVWIVYMVAKGWGPLHFYYKQSDLVGFHQKATNFN